MCIGTLFDLKKDHAFYYAINGKVLLVYFLTKKMLVEHAIDTIIRFYYNRFYVYDLRGHLFVGHNTQVVVVTVLFIIDNCLEVYIIANMNEICVKIIKKNYTIILAFE